MFNGLTLFFIIVVLVTFFILILGLIFAIYIVYNKQSKNIEELSYNEKEIIEKTNIKETSSKKFEHIYFL